MNGLIVWGFVKEAVSGKVSRVWSGWGVQHLVGLLASGYDCSALEGRLAGPPSGVAPRPCSGLCWSARRRASLAAVPLPASETYLPHFCP